MKTYTIERGTFPKGEFGKCRYVALKKIQGYKNALAYLNSLAERAMQKFGNVERISPRVFHTVNFATEYRFIINDYNASIFKGKI